MHLFKSYQSGPAKRKRWGSMRGRRKRYNKMPILVEPRHNEGPMDYENHLSYSVNCQHKFTYEKLYKSSCPNTKHQKFNLLALRRQNTEYLN